jgi:uncharacterized protein (TIGR00251 family)
LKDTRDSLTQAQPPWLTPCEGGVVIELRVQPGARHEGLAGEHDGRLKLALRASAIEGRANAALLRWLGECLLVPPSAVTLLRGAGTRIKRVRVAGIDAGTACERFGQAKKKEQP